MTTAPPTPYSFFPTPKRYDAIVIGGGHNGLINAAYLAKSGLKTLVLEKRDFVGGAAITEELLPGYRFTTFSYALSLIRPDIVQDLNLVEHGMMTLPMPKHLQVGLDGTHLVLGADKYENYHEIARVSAEDAEGYWEYARIIDRVCNAVKPLMDSIPPNVRSSAPEDKAAVAELNAYLKGLDPDVQEMLSRLWTGSISDVLDDYFESELVKGMICSSSVIGSMCGPKSAESGKVYLFHKLGEYDGIFGEWGFHKNGNGGFTQTLARAVESFGGEIHCGIGVTDVIVRDGKASGVILENGATVEADIVVSALDPRRTFTQLVDPKTLPSDLTDAIGDYKFQGTAAKVNFALSAVPTAPGLEGRDDAFQGFTNIGPSIDYYEDAFADAVAGRWSKRPFIDACVQSLIDPDMAPAGKHVMSCFVMYVPYHLADGDWDSQREAFGDTVQETLNEFFPGFHDLVIHREIVTPLDIERVVGLTEGNIFQGELFGSQMFTHRPAPGWNQYRTPIVGYYQCGSGTHPGGCVIGAPGKLAAQQIMHDTAETPQRGVSTTT